MFATFPGLPSESFPRIQDIERRNAIWLTEHRAEPSPQGYFVSALDSDGIPYTVAGPFATVDAALTECGHRDPEGESDFGVSESTS